jgi:ROK family
VPLLAAVDIGGTNTLAEVFGAGSNGRGVAFPTPTKADLLCPLCDVLDDLADGGAISAVVIGCPGPLDRTQGVVLNPPNLARGWWGLQIADRLQGRFHCAVALENDANLGALGEACLGGGQGFHSVLYSPCRLESEAALSLTARSFVAAGASPENWDTRRWLQRTHRCAGVDEKDASRRWRRDRRSRVVHASEAGAMIPSRSRPARLPPPPSREITSRDRGVAGSGYVSRSRNRQFRIRI